jgi:hypothetical protein
MPGVLWIHAVAFGALDNAGVSVVTGVPLDGVPAADNIPAVVGSLLLLSRVPDVADVVLLLLSLLSYAWHPSACMNVCTANAHLLNYLPIG